MTDWNISHEKKIKEWHNSTKDEPRDNHTT